jgi:hypothetical protein
VTNVRTFLTEEIMSFLHCVSSNAGPRHYTWYRINSGAHLKHGYFTAYIEWLINGLNLL